MVTSLRKTMSSLSLSKLKKKTPLEKLDKPKRKIDRFDGLSEEEVQKYTLPDYLEMNLDIVFVGINPSLMAAHRGRYYAGPGNHFYKLLHESGLVPRFVSYEEDYKLLQYGIGLTNIVTRATRSSADLKRTEIKEGSKIVEDKLKFFKPKVAVFNGKCIYEVFAHKTGKFNFGLQLERIDNTAVWVVPSSSARCANFPRMVDKLHFYTALKKYLQLLKGEIKDVNTTEFFFEGKCKQFIPSTSKMWRRKNMSAFLHGGRIANKDTVCLDTSEENVAMAHSTEFIVKEIKSVMDDEIEKQHAIENTGEGQTSGTVCSQESIEMSANCASLQERNGELVHNDKTDNNNVNNCNVKKSKVQVINRRRKAKVKKLSIEQVTRKTYIDNNTSDFISLIKQRLQNKASNGISEKNNIEDKEIKYYNVRSKVDKSRTNSRTENIDEHDSSTSEC